MADNFIFSKKKKKSGNFWKREIIFKSEIYLTYFSNFSLQTFILDIIMSQRLKLETASQVPMAPKDRNLGVKFKTAFKVIVVKTKFLVAKYD